MNLKSTLYVALLGTGYTIGLLVANRPRFWWQDVFHNAALYWIFPALCAALWLALHMWIKRRWSWFAALACMAYVCSVGTMVKRVWPYVWFDRWTGKRIESTATSVSGMWIDSWTEQQDPRALMSIVERYSPTIIAISGRIPDAHNFAVPLDRYPHRLTLQAADSGEISFMSQLPIGAGAKLDLGINAAVGGFIPVQLTAGKTVQIGTIDLKQATTPADFEQKRISARRLSALIRNGADTRIVLGQFNCTPFSQLVSIYTQQARVRSLRFNSGPLQSLRILRYCRTECPAQAFVSRDVLPEHVEEFRLAGREQQGLFFRVLIPNK